MPPKPVNPFLKLALEFAPLGLFFIANGRFGIFAATAIFMAAILVALAVSYVLMRKLPIMALVSAVVVVVFGGLTLALHDDLFIKMKPTIVNSLFGGALL
ncbi:MAG: septation protein IspZ, partial [Hyphomicrobiales bacterium]|nr:septation protein IspZ [Hyphomicrobiales bacterium]